VSDTPLLTEQLILKKPWSALARQREAATFGIWAFLASEALFFGALLLAYTMARLENPVAFAIAARQTNVFYGTLNTAILLTSSLTMAVAAQAASTKADFRRLIVGCLAATAALGIAFLIVKGFEYREDFAKHLVPGSDFALPQPAAQIFFALYWTITGVHAIHLAIGIMLVLRLTLLGALRRLPLRCNPQVEVTALYWHLVDIIWVFVYPLIYLPGRGA
jgi:cytochrome c oxidase subunit 3